MTAVRESPSDRPAPPRVAWRGVWGVALEAVVLCCIFGVPLVASPYQVGLLAQFLTFGLLALSLDLLWDRGGLISFGHSALFGLGAYAFALTLAQRSGVGSTYVAYLLAVLVPAGWAALLGAWLFLGRHRVGGVFFGIINLAITVILQLLATGASGLTGGSNGLYGFAIPELAPGLRVAGTLVPYYLIAASAVLLYYGVRALTRSTFGLALLAARQDAKRAEGLGVPIGFFQLVVFVLSGAIAGLAGALYVPVGFVSPDLFGVLLSTSAIVWVVVGGRGTLLGPFVGAVGVNELEIILSGRFVSVWQLIVGLILVTVVLAWPKGAMGAAGALVGRGRRA